MKHTAICALLFGVLTSTPAMAQQWSEYGEFEDFGEETTRFSELVLDNSLRLGFRTSTFSLENDTEAENASDSFYYDSEGHYVEGYFIGSIDALRDEQVTGFGKNSFFVQWYPLGAIGNWDIWGGPEESARDVKNPAKYILSNIGIEWSWSEVRGETWTTEQFDSAGNLTKGGYSDGTVVAESSIVCAILRLPMRIEGIRIIPYAGIGKATCNSPEVTEGAWHWGFSGDDSAAAYDAWVASGSQGNPNGGYRRTFTLDGDTSDVLTYGVALEISDNLGIEFYAREVSDLVFFNTFTLSVVDDNEVTRAIVARTRYSEFDLSHHMYGFGVSYCF